jgi:mono/diheme cytochrome c family protein
VKIGRANFKSKISDFKFEISNLKSNLKFAISNFTFPAVLCMAALLLFGCRFEPEHNMAKQPAKRPYQESVTFADGTEARPLPPGVVPRASAAGHPYADERDALPADTTVAALNQTIPFPITRELLERGQERFNIYCSACHGRLGNGDGMIVHRGFSPPPSFHIDRLRTAPDSHFYNVISNGYGAMLSYNDRVRPEDRWMIVAYIRALQSSTSQLKPEQLQALNLQGVRP